MKASARRSALVSLVPWLLLGCTLAPTEEGGLGRVAGPLLANPDFYWPKDSSGAVTIPVCWESNAFGSAALTSARYSVQAAVHQWARYAPIAFTGFGQCAANPTGPIVRISHVPGVRPHSAGTWTAAGYLAYANGTGVMELDLLMNCPGYTTNQHCIGSIAGHEFGHVLGFWHEEERQDWVSPSPLPSGSNADACAWQDVSSHIDYDELVNLGARNVDSIMSYCGQPANDVRTWKETLSAGDIAALQDAYGRKRVGDLVTPGGYCLTAASPSNGSKPVTASCDALGSSTNQTWVRDGERLRRYATTQCLNVKDGSTANGAQIETTLCSTSSANQKFSFAHVALRGWGGKCLDVPNGNAVAGQKVQMFECVGEFTDSVICPSPFDVTQPHDVKCELQSWSAANQRWNVRSDNLIQFVGTNLCLAYGSFTDGNQLRLATCNASDVKQKFYFNTNGSLRMKDVSGNQKCLDHPAPLDADYEDGNGLPSNYTVPQLWPCLSAQLNQKWNLTGAVSWTDKSKAIRRRGDGTGSDTTSWAFSPGTALNGYMKWDYYFRP